ncbi:TlpA family protein disulfide reductase [Tenacibaculum xiamenense]|uniref:TlpA family protein disulfide reductase n=1 Tax=Tenacibaculum xiamenense TaxID=1261553 RepID=UPI003893AC61
MKISHLLLLLLCFIFLTTSCNSPTPIEQLIIKGKIDGFKKKEIKLTSYNYEHKIKINKSSKTFNDTIKIPRTGYYNLVFSKNKYLTLYLTKSDNLEINSNLKNLEKTSFKGDNKQVNNYFIKKSKLYSSIVKSAYVLFKQNEESFTQTMDNYKDSLKSLCASNKFPVDIENKEYRHIDYEITRNFNNYEDFHGKLTGETDFNVSSAFSQKIPEIKLDHREDYLDFLSYRKYIQELLERKTNKTNTEDQNSKPFINYLKTVTNNINDTLIKNDLFFTKGIKQITYTDYIKEYYDYYIKNSTNNTYNNKITEKYNVLKLTAKGNNTPKFFDYENYEGGINSLDDFLNNGKYKLIDVWATWCNVCEREIPLLKRFEVLYHDKNIEFIGISVDKKSSFDKWKKVIKTKELSGHQLFADNEMKSDFIQKYAIEGLPRFIILDPTGKIVTPNAPRPSEDDKLKNIIDNLNI